MSQSTVWERLRSGSKTGFDKAWKAVDKLGAPVNKLSNKLGSEAFWPTTLDKESDKAARILKSFCKDGFYAEEEVQPQDGPKRKQRVVQKIPEKVIQKAKGLAIFTTMRTGLWISGAGGSGVLIARKADGTWSSPSGILLHTAGLGFLVGVDIYDCVIVINTEKALDAFTKLRCTLGSEISVAAGPVGAGGILDTEIHKRQSPIYTYLKSRGFYAGVQIDGTIIIERTDENERFYGERIPVKQILEGKVRHVPFEVKRLMETIKAAQGDGDVDEQMLPTEAPPGDFEIDSSHTFGVPDQDDPDPYGVLALEKEGMSLKEAGTKKRASWEEFSFKPSPTSPIRSMIARQGDANRNSLSTRSSWRTSTWTNEPKSPSSLRTSMELARPMVTMTDAYTQTNTSEESAPSETTRSRSRRRGSKESIANTLSSSSHMQDVPEDAVLETSRERKEPASVSKANGYTTPPRTPPAESHEDDEQPKSDLKELPRDIVYDNNHPEPVKKESEMEDDEDEDEDEPHIEEPTVQSVQSVQTFPPTSPSMVSKARIVNVPKRIPPKLPPRNPNRSGPLIVDASSQQDEAVSPGAVSVESRDNATEIPETIQLTELDQVEHRTKDLQLNQGEEARDGTSPEAASAVDKHQTTEESQKMPGGFD